MLMLPGKNGRTATFGRTYVSMNRFSFAIFCLLLVACSCNNDKGANDPDNPEPVNPNVPASISYQIMKVYPHDTAAFTEGLQYVSGKLYESTGEYNKSDVRITDLATGKVELKKPLDGKYFGEGITVLNGKAYQLTYKENTGFVYDAKTLKLEKTFTYNEGEGWGLTNNGKHLIMSTGGSNLYFLDPNTLKEVSRIGVTNQYGPVNNINELEYIKGYIYANQWEYDGILKIDPNSGKVVAVADLGTFRAKAGISDAFRTTGEGAEVLNGIAYDSIGNRIFITGKYWPKLFEVKLDN
jgi:glutaminyl-peptide cyclotransferase